MGALSPWHILIVLGIVLLLFGPSRLPRLGESFGRTVRAVRDGMSEESEDAKPGPPSGDR
jgi:sec-independent protein translocase protein TatA